LAVKTSVRLWAEMVPTIAMKAGRKFLSCILMVVCMC
jgi:hypothetical protein